MKLRNYQREAVDAVFDYWREGGEEAGNPLVNMATGLGKSCTVAEVARELCAWDETMRVLMLVHVQELVSQNFETLLRVWPGAPVGVYCAGLSKRQLGRKITYGSIASLYKKAAGIGPVDVVLVDEAHLIPFGSEGMYRTLFTELKKLRPEMRIVGFTATPFRTGAGRLDQGPDRLFDEIVYNYGVGDGVRDGWLAPLAGYQGTVEFDVSGIGKRGGEFIQADLDASFNAQEAILQQAVEEIVVAGADRKSWLLFGSGVKHAMRIAECLRDRGITAETVTGETPKDERARLLHAFKRGEIRALTNANVLTTGFDAPGVDLIALLRSTLSTVLYVQMMGRGTRVNGVDLSVFATAEQRLEAIGFSVKPDCRILDYGGNIRRHGPVDAIWIKPKGPKGAIDDDTVATVATVKARICPSCVQYISAQAIICPICGHEDESMLKAKHDAEAEKDIAPMALNAPKVDPQKAEVMAWSFKKHLKYGADPETTPPTFRVDFMAGMSKVSEYLAFEHEGGASRAVKWWKQHSGRMPAPDTVDEALKRIDELKMPREITVDTDKNGYLRIVDRAFKVSDPEISFAYDPPQKKIDWSAEFDGDDIPF